MACAHKDSPSGTALACNLDAITSAASSVARCKDVVSALGMSFTKSGMYSSDDSGCTYHPPGFVQVMNSGRDSGKTPAPTCDVVNADRSRRRVCACTPAPVCGRVLISRQTVVAGDGWLRSDAEWSINPHDPSAAQFSILDQLDEGMGRRSDVEVNPPECDRAYSSVWQNEACGISHARSMLDSPQAWSAAANTAGQWMRIDAGSALSVYGVRVQGRAAGRYSNQKVTAFTVQHSTDDSTWSDVDGGAAFTDDSGDFNALFATPVMAQYIRITVVLWHKHISMRAGLLTGDNKFLFELYWPELEGSPKGPRQMWKQTSNPVTGVPGAAVSGYEAVDAPYTGSYWGGLQRSGSSALLDGSRGGEWWYAVGSRSIYHGGIPGPDGITVTQTELYVHTTPCTD